MVLEASNMEWDGRSWEIAIPRANLVGPKSTISHWDSRNALNDAVSSGEEAAEKMSSTCNKKMIVLVGD